MEPGFYSETRKPVKQFASLLPLIPLMTRIVSGEAYQIRNNIKMILSVSCA